VAGHVKHHRKFVEKQPEIETEQLTETSTADSTTHDLSGVNVINILVVPFCALCSFSLITVWHSKFWHKNIGAKAEC